MKVLVADDHPMVRDALARTLRLLDAQPTTVFEAGDYPGIERVLLEERPPLAIVDLNMPGMDGVSGLSRLRAAFPEVTLVVASGVEEPETIRRILAAGVSGFLPKSEAPEVLLQALRLVLSGGVYMPRQALADLQKGALPEQKAGVGELTPRQCDVLRQLMQGQPNKTIARHLGLTEGTVKIHIAAILRVLNARNRTEAVLRARSMGLGI